MNQKFGKMQPIRGLVLVKIKPIKISVISFFFLLLLVFYF
uniref:Uncharacterized protein n=1 Tax=Anguilla anguilla TaxID=7936 RepID=A0A0E9V1P3_ANGAN